LEAVQAHERHKEKKYSIRQLCHSKHLNGLRLKRLDSVYSDKKGFHSLKAEKTT
jgi:hypothetical protein